MWSLTAAVLGAALILVAFFLGLEALSVIAIDALSFLLADPRWTTAELGLMICLALLSGAGIGAALQFALPHVEFVWMRPGILRWPLFVRQAQPIGEWFYWRHRGLVHRVPMSWVTLAGRKIRINGWWEPRVVQDADAKHDIDLVPASMEMTHEEVGDRQRSLDRSRRRAEQIDRVDDEQDPPRRRRRG